MSDPVFMDLEASSLISGFPVEIGWARQEGISVRMNSILVAPPDKWLETCAWDQNAQHIHGVTLDLLRSQGHLPSDVCRYINNELENVAVVLDTGATGADVQWLKQLYAEARTEPSFTILTATSEEVVQNRLGFWNVPPEHLQIMHEHAPTPPHRAAEDAAVWAWWLIAVEFASSQPSGADNKSFASQLKSIEIPRSR
ncbi:hypothetical protein [Ferrovibrio terrae]|uniref:hypothetical protein n=1 Tax=Ferrovibrio terrae TaxID=2594003 RepID=UPI003137DAA7